MSKSSGKQFLLNIKPKYRKNVSVILEEKKKNREASEWVCQAILEKYTREQMSIETQVQQMLQSGKSHEQVVSGGLDLHSIAQILSTNQLPLQMFNPNTVTQQTNGLVEQNDNAEQNKQVIISQNNRINEERKQTVATTSTTTVSKGKNSLLSKLKRS